jgi:hypothetical protein
MSEDQRILGQLRRLGLIGYTRIPGRQGMELYVEALAEWPPEILEMAVLRWIQYDTTRFFPMPGELRKMVQEEIHAYEGLRLRLLEDAERERQDREVERMRLELIAKGITWPGMPNISREEAERKLLTILGESFALGHGK